MGARFDPNTHEAVTTIPVTDLAMDDVVEVFSAAFRIGRLIAPARVVGRLAESPGRHERFGGRAAPAHRPCIRRSAPTRATPGACAWASGHACTSSTPWASTSDKAVRRAGLDYWRHVDVVEHDDAAAFFGWAAGRRVWAFSARGTRSYTAPTYGHGDVLLFGRESRGLPPEVVVEHDGGLRIPVLDAVRSLNLSNAIAVAAYRAMGDIDPGWC